MLLVLAEELGWRTHANQMKRVLAERDDFEWEVFTPKLPRWVKAPLKRHNMSRLDRLCRHVDPITAYRGPLGSRVRAAVARFGPDLVHVGAQLPAASLLGRPDAPPYTLSLDTTRVNMNALKEMRIWSQADLAREAELLRGAAHSFPWSDWAGRASTGEYGVEAGRVTVVPPSVDPAVFGTPRARVPNAVPRVLFIGNDFLRKGGDMLYRWVTGPLAGTCELHIVSGDPAAAQLGGPGVVVHGPVPHARLTGEILPSMDLLCHPTQSDMSAYVVVEAAFAGLPAITSRVGGIPELVIEGETGWTLERRDEAGFVRTLKMVLADPDRVAEAGRQARRRAEDRFDAGKNYNRLFDRLKELALRRTAAR